MSALVDFILEAKRRGFDNPKIRAALKGEGWTTQEIHDAFDIAQNTKGAKRTVSISLDESVFHAIERRAKKNLLSVPEQIEDIIRRSAVNTRPGVPKPDRLDDLLVSIFSRKRR